MEIRLKISLLFLFTCSFLKSTAQVTELEIFFKSQKEIKTYRRIVPSNLKYVDYEIQIRQLLDHKDSTKGFFNQKIYLSHLNFKSPSVMKIAGYSLGKNDNAEITNILKCNQIEIEHRYYGASKPKIKDSLDYSYLNLEQASADLHYIFEIFQKLYPKKWLSTGASKGGISTLYYKYYYPDDIKASIAYVSPLPNSVEDPRIYSFLDTIGSVECREKIEQFQLLLLKNRDSILPQLKTYYDKEKTTFNYLSFEEAFEVSILEFSFYFWQWGGNCDELPGLNSSIKELIDYYQPKKLLPFFSDISMEYYSSHYYQSATEIGYYGYRLDKYKDYIKVISKDSNYSAIFTPNKIVLEFDSSLNASLNDWLDANGNNIIYVYGNQDTWTACAINPSDKVNSKKYLMIGKNHGNATILEMSKKDKKECLKLIKTWLK